jgi:hypothetical protein
VVDELDSVSMHQEFDVTAQRMGVAVGHVVMLMML